jgi:hypothetical protein
VTNASRLFESALLSRHAEKAPQTDSVQRTIQLIEPLKTAGRRILAAFAARATNFGPSIR